MNKLVIPTLLITLLAPTTIAGCTTVPEPATPTPTSNSETQNPDTPAGETSAAKLPNSTTTSSIDTFCSTLKTTTENVSSTIAEDNGNTAKIGEQFTALSQTAAELNEQTISEGLYSLSNALLTPQNPGSAGEQNLWETANTNMQQADKRLQRLCGFTVYKTLG